LKILESKLLETLRDKAFKTRANKAGFIVDPMGVKETEARWKQDDETLYPILLEAGLVKTRKK
jgi:hypothetical protein